MSESNGDMSAFVDDDCVEKAFIQGVPRLHPEMRFSYRPALISERKAFFEENAKLSAAQQTTNTAKRIAAKIASWDQKDKAGRSVPVTPERLSRLRPALHDRIVGIVLGIDPPDEDPEATQEEHARLTADKAEAASTGQSIGSVRQENAEKKS